MLISHLHHDHADLPSLRRLGRERAGARARRGAGGFLERAAASRDVTELAPGESSRVGGVDGHRGRGRAPRRRAALRAGARRRSASCSPATRRVYFAGDTDLFDGMEELGGRPRPRAAAGLGLGAEPRARATSTPSARRGRRRCSRRGSRSRSTGGRSSRSASPGCARAACARRRASSRAACGELAPQVEVRVLAPGRGDLALVGRRARARRASRGRSGGPVSAPTTSSSGQAQLAGVQDEGEALRPAHAAVRADQLLEGGDLAELRPEGAVDHQVGAVREAVGAPQVVGGVGAEGRQRVLALDPALVEEVDARRADRDRAVALRADQDEADPGVLAERREQARDRAPRSAPG